MSSVFGERVHIEFFRHPADGAVIITRCPECRHIEIAHSPHAIMPKNKDHNAWVFTWKCWKCFCLRPPMFEFPRDRFFRPLEVLGAEQC